MRKSLHTLTEQLSDAIKKITDIATINGFNNISYFNREFMKLMKMTPSEYRKSMVPPL
ncbi:MAG: helix-turn-helix domain-containing protein [Clostridiales bacterium]|nr:helix-turn-helix domain-containing protein [uncultured Anaerosporobacter sp.]MBS5935001.1 helix-turn-helix domain-containing protein [Clostridiales bacterium]